MDANGTPLADGYRFSGRAGDLQRRRQIGGLVRELGENYDLYHSELSRELDLSPQPEPEECKTFAEYAAAGARMFAIIHAEATLRVCRAAQTSGRPLDAAGVDDQPLTDPEGRLVSVRTGRPLARP
jgi:hypothetical protein